MNKIPVFNDTNMPLYVGAAMVLPGETRHFEEYEVPQHLRPKAKEVEQEQQADPLSEFLKRNVKDVVAALAGLSLAEIERLAELEQQGQQRKGVLTAIAETLLIRASQDELLKKVGTLSDADLAAALEEAKTDININPAYLAALEAESAKRSSGAAE